MNISFAEKSVWVQMLGMLVVLGAYFIIAAAMLRAGVSPLAAYVPLFVASVVLMVVVQIIGHIWAALSGQGQEQDERDRIIAWRAESRSAWLVVTGVILGITALVLSVSPVWIAHLLLLFLFSAEIVKYALQLHDYRRGF